MAGITTAMATSFKSELFAGGHCFNATVTPTASVANASTSMTAVSSMAGVAVGMNVTGTGINPNAVVATVTGSNTLTLSIAATAAVNGAALTFAGDVFKMALVKQGMAGTYDSTSVNYTQMAADEVTNAAGSAYTAGGLALSNVSPTTSGTVAWVTFSPNPSWTTATFSTAGCMIYNSTVRNGGVTGTNATGGGRCCSVHSFGGSQQVSSGTFTVLMPSADSNNAILRLS